MGNDGNRVGMGASEGREGSFGPDAFQAETGVSRETLDRLAAYAACLADWSTRKNLIAASTLPALWHRHLFDSAQLLPLLPPTTPTLLDLGSGAGFPGLVLAILGVPHVHLVESDQGKATFLTAAAAAAGVSERVTVHAVRAETLDPPPDLAAGGVVTARALAPLDRLLPLVARFLPPAGLAILPKGAKAQAELAAARRAWRFDVHASPSRTDPSATILRISSLTPLRRDVPRPGGGR